MKEHFIDTIKTMINIPDDQIKLILNIIRQKELLKGEYFIRAGDTPDEFGFVLKGLFRYYYTDTEGNEFTKSFITESDFLISYTAMVQNTESYYSIEALEESTILVIKYDNWKNLVFRHECWNLLIKSLLESAYIKKEKREREFLLDSAEIRYKRFLKENSNLIERIKQYQIASYLGITPVALSRIKKSMFLT